MLDAVKDDGTCARAAQVAGCDRTLRHKKALFFGTFFFASEKESTSKKIFLLKIKINLKKF